MKALAHKTHFLFDLDGTLVDSAPLHAKAYLGVLQRLASPLAAKFDYETLSGKTTRLAFAEMGFPKAEIEALVREKQTAYLDMLEQGQLPIFEGAHELMATLKSRGAIVYLVTSASRRSTRKVLASTGLGAHFRDVVTGDDVKNGKPAPDGYRKIIETHRIDPVTALVVEDAVAGLKSAAAASVEAVTVNQKSPLAATSLATFESLKHFHQALHAAVSD